MVSEQEKIFYDWLFATDEERKKWNPFVKMLNQSAKQWPKVPKPNL